MSKAKRTIISLTVQQDADLEKLMKDGVYRTKAEAIRDAVRILVRQKKEESK